MGVKELDLATTQYSSKMFNTKEKERAISFKGVAGLRKEIFVVCSWFLFVFSYQKEALAHFHSEREAAEKESAKTRG